jgi:hypothetical protein
LVYYCSVVNIHNYKDNPNNMPRVKNKLKYISDDLSKKAKTLLNSDDKTAISKKLNVGDSYISMVINQKRWNKEIEKELTKRVNNKIAELTK